MFRRIFLKSLIILILVSLPKAYLTNAYFTNVAASSGNTFTVGDWTAPESELDQLPSYQNSNNFTLTYTAVDEISGVDRVLLYYRHQGEEWILTATDEDVTDSFDFTANGGDGEYEFFSIAIDNAGNIEDDADENGTLDPIELEALLPDTFTTVDTSPPVTMLSIPSYLAVVNELLYNGGFENGNLDGWIASSSGSDHQATTDDQKTGIYSALIGFRDATPSAEPAFDSIKQNVSLPPWMTSTLSFWYHLLTSDTVSGGFFDVFVTPVGSDPITVAHDGWDDPEVMEEDLDWKNVTYQLNGLEGENIGIEFKVTQPYEGYQTWAYLDDVKLTAATNSATISTPLALTGSDGGGSNNLNITYTLDNNLPTTYSGIPITLGTPGEHTLKYFSTDAAGNSETPKQATISATAAPVDFGVVLNEFLPNPAGDDSTTAPNGEWVELYNNLDNPVDVNGWKLEDAGGNQMIISAVKTKGTGTIILAGSKLKIYRRGSGEISGPAFIMNNTGDTVKLLKPDGNLVDSYNYTFSVENKSFKRDPDGTGGWKDPEAETTSETSPTPTPTVEPTPVPSTTPTPSPSPEVSPAPTPEPSNIPNPVPTPVAEPPTDESVKEPQAEEPPQNQTSLPEEGNEINE